MSVEICVQVKAPISYMVKLEKQCVSGNSKQIWHGMQIITCTNRNDLF